MRRTFLFLLSLILPIFAIAATTITPISASGMTVNQAATRTPTVTRTPIPTPTITPTPVATEFSQQALGAGANRYQLKEEWTPADAQAALDQLKEAQNGQNRFAPDDYRQAYMTLLKESDFRFAPLDEGVELRKNLAAESIASGDDFFGMPRGSIRPLLMLLEQALNDGETDLTKLNDWLKDFNANLKADEPVTAENLLVMGQDDTLLTLRLQENVLPVAVKGSQAGEYRLYPVYEQWPGREILNQSTVELTDLNNNRKAEVTIKYQWDGSDHCMASLAVYEWDGMKFINIAVNVAEQTGNTLAGTCQGYSFVPGPDGKQSIVSTIQSKYVTQTRVYDWDETAYEWTRDETKLASVPTAQGERVQWALAAGPSNDQALGILEGLVKNWSRSYEADYGPAARDYFRFKLGTWYAFRNEKSKAVSTLEAERDKPYKAQYPLFSEWSKTFLKSYIYKQEEVDGSITLKDYLFAGCSAVNQKFAKDREAFKLVGDELIAYDQVKMKEAWGYAQPEWAYGDEFVSYFASYNGSVNADSLGICNLQEAFTAELSRAKLPYPDGPADWLREKKIPYVRLYSGDINGDDPDDEKEWEIEEHDYLLMAGTGYMGRLQLWAIVRDGNDLKPALVQTFDTSDPKTGTLWNKYRPEYGFEPIHAYQVNDRMVLFRVFYKDGQTGITFPVDPSDRRARWASVNGMEMKKGVLRDRIYVTELNGDLNWLGWDAETRAVTFNGPSLGSRISEIENALFNPDSYNPAEAARLSKEVLRIWFDDERLVKSKRPTALYRTRPYVMYLLGLAQELDGKTADALKTYWQVAYKYPDNPYSMIIRMKLEPKK